MPARGYLSRLFTKTLAGMARSYTHTRIVRLKKQTRLSAGLFCD